MKLRTIKRVSQAKYIIWRRYLRRWFGRHREGRVYVIEFFAGPGIYPGGFRGTPIITAEEAARHAGGKREISLIFVESDGEIASRLRENLPEGVDRVSSSVINARAEEVIPHIAETLGDSPALVLVDPYGYPPPTRLLRELLRLPGAEAFVNFMWFRINMDLFRRGGELPIGRFWGRGFDGELVAPLRRLGKLWRSAAFLVRAAERISSRFCVPFRVCYGPDDVVGKLRSVRTKYFLAHLSNSLWAALDARDVMWSVGDFPGSFRYTGLSDPQIPEPLLRRAEKALRDVLPGVLLSMFGGRRVKLGAVLEGTLGLPCRTETVVWALRRLGREGLLLADGAISARRLETNIRFAYAHAHENRVDRDLLEPVDRLHEGERGMRSLLRRAVRPEAAEDGKPKVQKGLSRGVASRARRRAP